MICFENAVNNNALFFGSSSDENTSDSLHVAYGADKNFLFGTGVSICSVLLNNKDMSFHFHIFTDILSDRDIELFKEITNLYNTNITLYTLNVDALRSLPTNKEWSYAIYFRLIIADYFYNKCDRILYMDSDVFCAGSIKELKKLDLTSTPVAAVMDVNDSFSIEMSELFNAEGIKKGYFNSGVMLINTEEWKCRQITEKSISVFTDNKLLSVIKYYDQDALNIAINGDWLKLDTNFNLKINLNDKYKNRAIRIVSPPVLVHFIGVTKPWHSWSKYYHEVNYFLNAKEKSPWKNISLITPQNITHRKYAFKHLKYCKEYLQAFYQYILYAYLKILRK